MWSWRCKDGEDGDGGLWQRRECKNRRLCYITILLSVIIDHIHIYDIYIYIYDLYDLYIYI